MGLLTNNFDTLSAALTPVRSGRGRGSGKSNAYGIQKLRELILELAVRGKLVPQDKNDEPASELLKKIQAEKAKLIVQGKIKKDKALPIIGDDETFDVPKSWQWIRLGSVIDFVNGFAFSSGDFSEKGIGIVKIGDIQDGNLTPETMSRVSKEVVASLDKRLRVEKGDLLIAMSGATTGKLGFNNTDEIFYLNQRVGKIVPIILSDRFLYLGLTTKIAENLNKSVGSAIPNLSTEQINEIVVALPPLAEQHRIVAKVDELMVLCDELEAQQGNASQAHEKLVSVLLDALTQSADAKEFADSWARIAKHFDELFTTPDSIDKLKQTVLQLAVMGRLSYNGERVVANVDDDFYKLSIPKHWQAKMLSECTVATQGVQIEKARQIFNEKKGYIRYLYISDFNDDAGLKYVSDIYENKIVTIDDLVMANTGATCGRVYRGKYGVLSNNLFKISFSKSVFHTEFLFRFLSSLLFLNGITRFVKGGANPHMGHKTYGNQYVFIPPLEEQLSIISKVDELMALCDTLKARITESNELQQKIADVLVKEAVTQ